MQTVGVASTRFALCFHIHLLFIVAIAKSHIVYHHHFFCTKGLWDLVELLLGKEWGKFSSAMQHVKQVKQDWLNAVTAVQVFYAFILKMQVCNASIMVAYTLLV